MKREDRILKYVNKSQLGLEIAPYHNPLAPKSGGWNTMSLDVFPTEKLKNLAKNDSNPFVQENVSKIESVDIIASASDLEYVIHEKNLLSRFDYICSSHNFEHLPNPIAFLRSCGDLLKPDGYLSMAIPNKRYTFDYAKPLSGTTDFLKAYHESHTMPDAFKCFESQAYYVEKKNGTYFYPNDLEESYSILKKRLKVHEHYLDSHVSIFTPESFVNIINDLMILELIPLELVEIDILGFEFICHFKNIGYESISNAKEGFIHRRNSFAAICNKC